jgi:hypothetical protein
MASMGFDQATLSLMLNIAEDRMETDLSECDYLKICNALKALNQSMSRPQEQPLRQPRQPQQPVVIDLVELDNNGQRLRALNHVLEQSIRRRQLFEDSRVRNLNVRTPKVLLSHKQKVIETLLPHTVRRGNRGGFIKMTRYQIDTHMLDLLDANVLENTGEFHEKARAVAREEHENYLQQIVGFIEDTNVEIRSLERQIAEVVASQ